MLQSSDYHRFLTMHHHAPTSNRLGVLSFGLSPGKPCGTCRDFTGRLSSSSTTEWNQWPIFRGSDSSTVSWSHVFARLAPFETFSPTCWHVSNHALDNRIPGAINTFIEARLQTDALCTILVTRSWPSFHRNSEVLLYFDQLCQSLLCTAESPASKGSELM